MTEWAVARRIPRRSQTPSTALASWSAALASGIWVVLLEVRGPATPIGVSALSLVVVAVAIIGTALLARSLFGNRRSPWQRWVVATAVAGSALAVVTAVLPRATSSTALFYGLLPLGALVGAVMMGGADRRRCTRFGIAAAVWTAVVAWYWLVVEQGSADTLVWPTSDQLHYHRIAIRLMKGDLDELRYMIGLPVFLAPFELIGRVRTGSYRDANLVNLVALPTFVVLIGGAAILTLAEAAVRVLRRRNLQAFACAVVLGAGVLLAYATVVPTWIPTRNAELVPRRLLGLVFAPEPLTALFLGAVLWLLADAGDRRATSARMTGGDPVLLGLAAGLVMLTREPNALIVVLAAALLLWGGELWHRVVLPAAVATPVLLGQVAIWQATYGKVFAPNRDVLWDQPARINAWRIRAGRRYGYDDLSPPPRVALRWLQTNLMEVLTSYLVPMIVLGLLLGLLVVRFPRQWRLWSFATVFSVATVVFNSAYINHEVLFRYNATVVPVLATVFAAGVLTIAVRGPLSVEPSSGGRPDAAPAPAPADVLSDRRNGVGASRERRRSPPAPRGSGWPPP